MISAAVSAGKGTIDVGYEIAEIAKYADSIFNTIHPSLVGCFDELDLTFYQVSGFYQRDDV